MDNQNNAITTWTRVGDAVNQGAQVQPASNCIQGGIGGGYTYSTVGYCYTYPSNLAELEIRRVSNGIIAKRYGIEYVFKTPKELAAWICKELEVKKK
jgi:hypothetical protein